MVKKSSLTIFVSLSVQANFAITWNSTPIRLLSHLFRCCFFHRHLLAVSTQRLVHARHVPVGADGVPGVAKALSADRKQMPPKEEEKPTE